MIKLLENFWLKVLALVFGLLIWLHVATDKIYKYELKLPITEITLKDSLTLSKSPPESLMIKVSASGKQLLRRKWRDEGVRINATQYQTGRYIANISTVNAFLTNPSSKVALDEVISPTQLELNIDRLATVEVPVTADIVAEADEGFAVSYPVDVSPRTVTLQGPRSILGRFTSVLTEQRKLTNLRTGTSLTLPLVIPPGYRILLAPDSVRISIDVVPVKTRVYKKLPVVVFNVPAGQPVSVQPSTIAIEMTGPPDEIDLLNANAITVSADYLQADSEGRMEVRIDNPPGFKVKKASADTVSLLNPGNADSGN
jgi:YbbR domain-containing protein